MLHTPPRGPPSASASPLPTTQVHLSRAPQCPQGLGAEAGLDWRGRPTALALEPPGAQPFSLDPRGGLSLLPQHRAPCQGSSPAGLGDQGEQWGGGGGMGLPMGLLLDGKTRGICGSRQVFQGPETDPAAPPLGPCLPREGTGHPSPLLAAGRMHQNPPWQKGTCPPLCEMGRSTDPDSRAGKGPHGPPPQLKKGGLDSYHLPLLGPPSPQPRPLREVLAVAQRRVNMPGHTHTPALENGAGELTTGRVGDLGKPRGSQWHRRGCGKQMAQRR